MYKYQTYTHNRQWAVASDYKYSLYCNLCLLKNECFSNIFEKKIFNWFWTNMFFNFSRFHGVMVSTLDSESSDPSSNLGGTWSLIHICSFRKTELFRTFVQQLFITLEITRHRLKSITLKTDCRFGWPNSFWMF